GLLSGWFKYLRLSPQETEKLRSLNNQRQFQGRIQASFSNRKRRMDREIVAVADAQDQFKIHVKDPLFIIGVSLYWAEGSKRTSEFNFINSDPEMVSFMYRWIQRFLGIESNMIKCRLFTHRVPGFEHGELFWANKLGREPLSFQKTIFKPTGHQIKKNPNYHGC